MIGIFDGDFNNRFPIPNLDVMKLSAFYKDKMEVVHCIQEGYQLTPYSKLFYIKEEDNGKPIFENLKAQEKIVLDGRFFSYCCTTLPEGAALIAPDKSFYNNMTKDLDIIEKTNYTRLASNGFKIDTPALDRRQSNILYDENIFQIIDYVYFLKSLLAPTPNSRRLIAPLFLRFSQPAPDFESAIMFTTYYSKLNMVRANLPLVILPTIPTDLEIDILKKRYHPSRRDFGVRAFPQICMNEEELVDSCMTMLAFIHGCRMKGMIIPLVKPERSTTKWEKDILSFLNIYQTRNASSNFTNFLNLFNSSFAEKVSKDARYLRILGGQHGTKPNQRTYRKSKLIDFERD